MAEDKGERRRRRRWWRRAEPAGDSAAEAGTEAALEGCLGCDIHLLIALTLLAGLPFLLWSL